MPATSDDVIGEQYQWLWWYTCIWAGNTCTITPGGHACIFSKYHKSYCCCWLILITDAWIHQLMAKIAKETFSYRRLLCTRVNLNTRVCLFCNCALALAIYIFVGLTLMLLHLGKAYKPTKEPIYYRGPNRNRTHYLQTVATPPAASCPAHSLHATEIVSKNIIPMTCQRLHWTSDNPFGMHRCQQLYTYLTSSGMVWGSVDSQSLVMPSKVLGEDVGLFMIIISTTT